MIIMIINIILLKCNIHICQCACQDIYCSVVQMSNF